MTNDYDSLHRLWGKAHAAGSPIKFVRNAVVYSELELLTPGRTLDAGCGMGDYSMFLAKRGHSVTAFDPSSYAVKELRKKIQKGLSIDVHANTIEGFSSPQLYDNIVSIEVLEHLQYDHAAIRKLYSILKEGGSIVISVPATPLLFSDADRISGHYRRYTVGSLEKLLDGPGFKNIKIRKYGFPVLFTYSALRKLCLDKILIDYFASKSYDIENRPLSLSKLYPLVFVIDQMNAPFWSVGYVAICSK